MLGGLFDVDGKGVGGRQVAINLTPGSHNIDILGGSLNDSCSLKCRPTTDDQSLGIGSFLLKNLIEELQSFFVLVIFHMRYKNTLKHPLWIIKGYF